MSDIRIRPAAAEDDAALAELDRRIWSTRHAVIPRRAPGEPFFHEHSGPEHLLVAEADERLAGYIRVVPATPLESNAHVQQIQGLAVDHWARGRGVGRALLDAACDLARTRGARRLTLRVLGHNHRARRLYEAAGFVQEGLLPEEFLLDGVYADDVLMGLRLDTRQ